MYGYLNCQESSHVYAEHRNRLVIGRRFWNSRCVVRHMYFYSTRSTTVLNDWRNGRRATAPGSACRTSLSRLYSTPWVSYDCECARVRSGSKRSRDILGPGRARTTIYEARVLRGKLTQNLPAPVWANDCKSTRTNSLESLDIAVKWMSSLWVWYMEHSGTLNCRLPI